jgi:hypothetical protein
MKRDLISASKYCLFIIIMALSLTTGTMFGQQNQAKLLSVHDQSVKLTDNHSHNWDDLRMLLITVTDVNDSELHWKHETSFETKTGSWRLGKNLKSSDRGIKSDRIRPGKDFVAVYCLHCETVIWLYDSK